MKLITFTLYCLWCTFITVHAQNFKAAKVDDKDLTDQILNDPNFRFGGITVVNNPVVCPGDLLRLYDKCRGSLDQCSSCLGEAEKECNIKDTTGGVCYSCTSRAAANCDSAKPLCSGDQECKSNEQCVNFKCVKNS